MIAADVSSLTPAAVVLALVAGAASFLSPCVLPLVPAFLSYVSGVAVADLDRRRRDVVRTALSFVAGFTWSSWRWAPPPARPARCSPTNGAC